MTRVKKSEDTEKLIAAHWVSKWMTKVIFNKYRRFKQGIFNSASYYLDNDSLFLKQYKAFILQIMEATVISSSLFLFTVLYTFLTSS